MSAATDEVVVALYDYTAKDPEELSIRKNEQLTLVDAKFTWWKVRNSIGKMGLVPSNYLRRDKGKGESLVNRIAHKFPGGKKGKLMNSGGGGAAPTGGGGKPGMLASAGATPVSVPPTQVNEEYISKFNYDATKDDELSLTKGMRVLVLKMEEDGWWYGRDAERPGNPGWFPSNYVTKDVQTANTPVASKPQTNGCLMVVRSLYPFKTDNPEELRFEQDELLDIVEEPPDDPEWWMARNSDGIVGLVPKNYVEVVPDAQPVSGQRYDAVAQKAEGFIPSGNEENSNFDLVEHKDWFFGPLRRSDAEKLLSERAKNGEFLVRNCETSHGEYSISMKMPEKMRHFKVTVLPDGQYGIGQRRFDSIDALLEHYKRSPIFTNQEQGKFYLTNPVPR